MKRRSALQPYRTLRCEAAAAPRRAVLQLQQQQSQLQPDANVIRRRAVRRRRPLLWTRQRAGSAGRSGQVVHLTN